MAMDNVVCGVPTTPEGAGMVSPTDADVDMNSLFASYLLGEEKTLDKAISGQDLGCLASVDNFDFSNIDADVKLLPVDIFSATVAPCSPCSESSSAASQAAQETAGQDGSLGDASAPMSSNYMLRRQRPQPAAREERESSPAVSDLSSNTAGGKSLRWRPDPGRNARMAKLNREKKKAFVASLEDKVRQLEADKVAAARSHDKLTQQLVAAMQEVAYLKKVLENQSSIASLVSQVLGGACKATKVGVPAVSFGLSCSGEGSVNSRKRSMDDDVDPDSHLCLESCQGVKRACTRNEDSTTEGTVTVLPIQFNLHVHN